MVRVWSASCFIWPMAMLIVCVRTSSQFSDWFSSTTHPARNVSMRLSSSSSVLRRSAPPSPALAILHSFNTAHEKQSKKKKKAGKE